MENPSIERLVQEIQQIKIQYKNEVSGGRKQWPRAIRERVMQMLGHGSALREVSERTGISYHTIASWTAAAHRCKFHQLPVVGKSKKVERVKKIVTVTVAKKSKSEPRSKIATVTVKTPDGYLIRLDSAHDAIFILRQLRGGN